jgi:hypothetical protein
MTDFESVELNLRLI